MKKTNFIFMVLLIIPIAFASYGGEQEVVHSFDDCINFTVNVTADQTIDEGEYWFDNCSIIKNNIWECICDGEFNLTLNTKINTINDYNFTIDYSYQIEVEDEQVEVLEDIIVETDDIIVNDMDYTSGTLELNLTSTGNKTVIIFLGDLGKPYKLYVNDNEISFIYYNQTIEFDMSFSTKVVSLSYNYPAPAATPTGGSGSSSSSSFSCNLERYINEEVCQTTICPRYRELHDCSEAQWAKHLCCSTDSEDNISGEGSIQFENITEVYNNDIIEEPEVEGELEAEWVDKEKQNNAKIILPILMLFVLIVLSVIGYIKTKKNKGEDKNAKR